MIPEPTHKKFCEECGCPMLEELIGAETCMMMCGPDSLSLPLASRYDRKTGKRQWAYQYTCPRYRSFLKIFTNGHDKYFLEDIVTL